MHAQAIRTLLKLQLRIIAEQRDALHQSASECLSQRMNDDFLVCRPLKSDGIEHVTLGGESKIFGCVVCSIGVVKRSRRNFCGTLAVNTPRPGFVDGFTIHSEPAA